MAQSLIEIQFPLHLFGYLCLPSTCTLILICSSMFSTCQIGLTSNFALYLCSSQMEQDGVEMSLRLESIWSFSGMPDGAFSIKTIDRWPCRFTSIRVIPCTDVLIWVTWTGIIRLCCQLHHRRHAMHAYVNRFIASNARTPASDNGTWWRQQRRRVTTFANA